MEAVSGQHAPSDAAREGTAAATAPPSSATVAEGEAAAAPSIPTTVGPTLPMPTALPTTPTATPPAQPAQAPTAAALLSPMAPTPPPQPQPQQQQQQQQPGSAEGPDPTGDPPRALSPSAWWLATSSSVAGEADPPATGLPASVTPAGDRSDGVPSHAGDARTPRGPEVWLSVPPFRTPSPSPSARGGEEAPGPAAATAATAATAAAGAAAATVSPSTTTGSEASGAFSLREAVFVATTAAAAAAPVGHPPRSPEEGPGPSLESLGGGGMHSDLSDRERVSGRGTGAQAVETEAAGVSGTSRGLDMSRRDARPDRVAARQASLAEAAAAEASTAAAAASLDAASAARRGARGAPRDHSRGGVGAASAAPRPLEAPPASATAATAGWVSPEEASLTEEEARAIIDAADMAAAEAVVAAAEAEQAAAAASATPSAMPPSAAAAATRSARVRATVPAPTAQRQDSEGSAAARAIRLFPAADERGTPVPASGARASAGAGGGGAAAAAAAAAAGLSEEEEIAAAVAAVAELEARDQLQSGAGGGGGSGAGGGGGGGAEGGVAGPIVRGTPGKDVVVESRCSLCQSSINGVAAAGRPSLNSRSSTHDRKCRNCWRAVCDACIGAFWARTMVPPRYTHDSNAYRMRICKTCDTATEAFRKALLLGHTAVAMSAYSTGCVNLCRPYTIYHGELPVHCAASGGNMGLLSWLVDEMGCQLFMDHDKKVPIRDLRGLTVLGAAAVNGQVEAMRYLVNEKGCSVSEIRHLPTLKNALKICLGGKTDKKDSEISQYKVKSSTPDPPKGHFVGSPTDGCSTAAADDEGDDNCCIVCMDREVDCTLVPCGHHCCCVACASKFSLCPVCRTSVKQRIKAIPV